MKIYKYRPFADTEQDSEEVIKKYSERIRNILREGLFHFSSWQVLNDPMEGYFHYYEKDHSPDELRKVVEGKDGYGICSLSMVSNDILLWTHYASNHRGICIEIDADIDRSNEVTLEPVKYRPNIPWLRKNNGIIRDAKDILSTKISKWRYEQEIRAFCGGNNRKLKIGQTTKVILGLRAVGQLEELVTKHAGTVSIVKARLDFETNKIES